MNESRTCGFADQCFSSFPVMSTTFQWLRWKSSGLTGTPALEGGKGGSLGEIIDLRRGLMSRNNRSPEINAEKAGKAKIFHDISLIASIMFTANLLGTSFVCLIIKMFVLLPLLELTPVGLAAYFRKQRTIYKNAITLTENGWWTMQTD